MKIKANKFLAVMLILTAVLFTGCGDKKNSADEGELTRSVVTAAAETQKTETTTAEKQTTTTSATTTATTTTETEKQTTEAAKTSKKKKDKKKKKTTTTTTTVTEETSAEEETVTEGQSEYQNVRFRNKKLLNSHYEKHGIDMGFASAEEYEQAACAVVNNPDVLHKTEKEDGDDVYYVEATNEFVVVSKDGYLRTYFNPDKGKAYYDKQ